MYGAIIGDIVGSPYEFTLYNIKTTDFPLFSAKSRFTDDTVLTIAIADAIMQGYKDEEKTRELIIDNLHIYTRLFFSAGYGQRFVRWVANKCRAPYNSFGNGSAMRVSSVAWAYNSLEEVETYAKISAEVTHNHPEGIKGACAVASAIFMARKGASKEEIRDYIIKQYEYNLSRSLEEIRVNYIHVESCQESVPEAISAFLYSNDFEDCVRKAVSLGGDSDTIAAIAGSIAEAFYGTIPNEILEETYKRLDKDLLNALTSWNEWLACKGD